MEKYKIIALMTLYSNMKKFYSSDYKLTDPLKKSLYEICMTSIKEKLELSELKELLINYIESHSSLKNAPIKIDEYVRIISSWTEKLEVYLFTSALILMLNKNKLVCKIKDFTNKSIDDVSTDYHPLSLTYNSLTVAPVYMIRGITLNYIIQYIRDFYSADKDFAILIDYLEAKDINIIGPFDQIITESLKQGSLVSGGAIYEDSIYEYLTNTLGLDDEVNDIKTFTHEENNSLENDIEFVYAGLKFGISAKKSLRERYKQYVNTSSDGSSLDVMMTITLGTDLNETKAETLQNYGVYVFVSPEIYSERKYLQKMDNIYSIFDLTQELLDEIVFDTK